MQTVKKHSRRLVRSSSDYSFFGSAGGNSSICATDSLPLLLFHAEQDYKWLDEIWSNMSHVQRIEALIIHTDNKGRGLLIRAVRNQDYGLIHSLLINNRLDINQVDVYGNSALHHAIILNDGEALEILLSSPRIKCDTKNRDDQTAWDLLSALTESFSFTDIVREHCYARTLVDETVRNYRFSQPNQLVQATEILKQTIRRIYDATWSLGKYRDRPFPIDLVPWVVQQQIMEYRFSDEK